MSEQNARRTVELDDSVVERIEARLPHTEFDSVDAYLEYVAVEVLGHVEATVEHDGKAVDEAVVRDRLESLGYLDE